MLFKYLLLNGPSKPLKLILTITYNYTFIFSESREKLLCDMEQSMRTCNITVLLFLLFIIFIVGNISSYTYNIGNVKNLSIHFMVIGRIDFNILNASLQCCN